MHGHRFLSSLIVAAALLAPVSAQAAVRPKEGPGVQLRVYDRTHKDYHVWDDHENQAYRLYLGEQHRKYRGFSSLSRRQQTTYWNYRHTHGA